MTDIHSKKYETTSAELERIHAFYRLTSLTRLPAKKGDGIYNEATVYRGGKTHRVAWQSPSVDSQLRRGDIVIAHRVSSPSEVFGPCYPARLIRADRSEGIVNLFDLLPSAWLADPSLAARASVLWERMDKPMRRLFNAVLWERGRFLNYVTGSARPALLAAGSGSNLHIAVNLAEQALLLAEGLPTIEHGVLIAAALLQKAARVEDDRRAADGEMRPRVGGLWTGYQQTILQWLAAARSHVCIPDSFYDRLIHVLIAGHRSELSVFSLEAAILDSAWKLIDTSTRARPPGSKTVRAHHEIFY